MATELLPRRGCVFRVGDDDGDSFKLDPDLSGTEESPIILQSVNVENKAITLPVSTLDNTRILYVFGEAWGDISVGGIACLGQGGVGPALSSLVSWYEQHTVAKSESEIKVSLPGGVSYKFYLTGLVLGDASPEYQTFGFTVTGKVIATNE